MLIIFSDSQGVVHKEFIPEGKTANAEFYKGIKDRLLKRIQWVHPTAFCSRDFFLLHDNVPTHKSASVCQFLTQKNVTTLYHPLVLPRFISGRLFSVPQVQNKVKRTDVADIQEAVSDELKKVQKEFSWLLRNCLTTQKPVYTYANGAYFGFKKKYLPHVSSFLKKKISPKTFGLHYIYANLQTWPQAPRRNLATAINPRAADWIPMLELLFTAVTCYRMNVQTVCFFGKTFSMSIHKFYFQNCI